MLEVCKEMLDPLSSFFSSYIDLYSVPIEYRKAVCTTVLLTRNIVHMHTYSHADSHIHKHIHTVPEFQIGPTTQVNESTPDVEICITTSSSLGRDVVVTAETGPKRGAVNQATGKRLEASKFIQL